MTVDNEKERESGVKGVGWGHKKRSPQVRQHQTGAPRARPNATRRGALMGIMLPAPTRHRGGVQ